MNAVESLGLFGFVRLQMTDQMPAQRQRHRVHLRQRLLHLVFSKIDLAGGRRVDLLVQVDLAGEATKFGAREDDLLPIFEAAGAARATSVVGLMLIPPVADDPEEARPYFRMLNEVRERLLGRGVAGSMLKELSMGMSHDFEVAIEEGATLVRVGTAIFGDRSYV